MNTVSSFKKLPMIATVLMTLAIFPGVSMAEKGDGYGDRGRHDKQYSPDRKKSHNGDNYRGDKRGDRHASKSHRNDQPQRGYDKHSKRDKYWKGKQYGHLQSHAYNRYNHRDSGHRHGHDHTRYVVSDDGHRPHYVGFDELQLMIGLHNPNLDIVFRN